MSPLPQYREVGADHLAVRCSPMTFQEVDTIIVMASTSATSAGMALYCSSYMSSRKLVSPAACVYGDMSMVNNTLPSIVNYISDSGLQRCACTMLLIIEITSVGPTSSTCRQL